MPSEWANGEQSSEAESSDYVPEEDSDIAEGQGEQEKVDEDDSESDDSSPARGQSPVSTQ